MRQSRNSRKISTDLAFVSCGQQLVYSGKNDESVPLSQDNLAPTEIVIAGILLALARM